MSDKRAPNDVGNIIGAVIGLPITLFILVIWSPFLLLAAIFNLFSPDDRKTVAHAASQNNTGTLAKTPEKPTSTGAFLLIAACLFAVFASAQQPFRPSAGPLQPTRLFHLDQLVQLCGRYWIANHSKDTFWRKRGGIHKSQALGGLYSLSRFLLNARRNWIASSGSPFSACRVSRCNSFWASGARLLIRSKYELVSTWSAFSP